MECQIKQHKLTQNTKHHRIHVFKSEEARMRDAQIP